MGTGAFRDATRKKKADLLTELKKLKFTPMSELERAVAEVV